MNLSEIRQTVADLHVRPSKALGQNFLIDANIVRIILEAADLSRQDTVLEIGTGLGVLTIPLIERVGRVVAVERDRRFVDFLQEKIGKVKNFRMIPADARRLDFRTRLGLKNLRYKLVSNLPFSVGTHLLLRLVEEGPHPHKIVVTVQHEVAQRLAAAPGSKNYGAATILAQLFYGVHIVHKVSPTCFWPVPEVESAVVVMDWFPHPHLKKGRANKVLRLVRSGFGQRRKMLKGRLLALGFRSSDLEDAMQCADIAPTARAEEVSLDQWITLADELPDKR